MNLCKEVSYMATTKQKEAALDENAFAFPEKQKEPLTDARHVRNAIARFDQVEDVTDAERDRAWKRILKAARKYDVNVEVDNWHDLFAGGKAKKRN
jgi:hypothetical protein